MLRATRDGISLAVRVQPGAKKTAITGIYGEGDSAQLKIAVNAPPIDGRANDALVAFLARLFSLPKSAITLTSGTASRSKIFLLRGISIAQASSTISKSLSASN